MQRANIKKTNLNFTRLSRRTLTTKIVIHHTAGAAGTDPSAETIHGWHKNNGWSGIGYHYVIRKDGTIEEGRPHWTKGAHAEGHNYYTIGIHVGGNFEIDVLGDAQREMCAMLLANLCTDYGIPCDREHIVGHRDVGQTACPGKNLYNELDTIIGKANWYMTN